MPETKEQRIARLRREIDQTEESARRTLESAERKRERLALIENRPPAPSEANMMHVRVKFKGTTAIYTFLILQTPVGYFTTGTEKNSFFRTWDNLLDWLDSSDVQWHSGIEMLTLTGEMALPKRYEFGGLKLHGDMGLGGDYL